MESMVCLLQTGKGQTLLARSLPNPVQFLPKTPEKCLSLLETHPCTACPFPQLGIWATGINIWATGINIWAGGMPKAPGWFYLHEQLKFPISLICPTA